MADVRRPFKLDSESSRSAPPRTVIGRFARPDAVPANPLSEKKPAINDQQTMSGWAPGIGQGSAPIRGQSNPFPPVEPGASTKSGFKVS